MEYFLDRFKKSWKFSAYALIICFCFCLWHKSGDCTTNGNPISPSETSTVSSSLEADNHLQLKNLENTMIEAKFSIGVSRRLLLGGPGSSPPRCTSKCGRCTPCKPVHVPVPPGTPVTTEYYPEAWRCKCGNKLYMP